MLYKGVVFDFNGTLFWDTKLHNRAWDIFFERYRLSLSDEEKFRTMHGKNNRDILLSLFNKSLSKTQIQELILEKEGLYQKLCLKGDLSLAPGAEDFLCFLQAVGVPFTIATASGKENVDFYFENLGISRWFDYDKIVYNDGTIKGKPDPEIYLKALGVIGCKAAETVIFEDAVAGLQAARNAGAGRIVVVDSNDDDYSEWKDCPVIKNFNEVDRNWFLV